MTFVITSKVVSEFFEDEAVVVNLETGSYYSFRGAAVGIWKKVEEGGDTAQILNTTENQKAAEVFLAYLLTEALVDEDNSTISSISLDEKITGNPEYTKYDDMKDLLLLDPIHEVDKKGWPNKSSE